MSFTLPYVLLFIFAAYVVVAVNFNLWLIQFQIEAMRRQMSAATVFDRGESGVSALADLIAFSKLPSITQMQETVRRDPKLLDTIMQDLANGEADLARFVTRNHDVVRRILAMQIDTFRFNDLAAEIREMIFEYLVPQGERCALDPSNITVPGAFVGTGGNRGIIGYMLVSKAFHREIVPVLYRANQFCLIQPLTHGTALTKMSDQATANLTELTLQVKEFADLGAVWSTVLKDCVKLEKITLVFYHDAKAWMKCLSDLVLMDAGGRPKIELLIYASIWAQPLTHRQYREKFERGLKAAERRKLFCPMGPLPSKIKTIVVSVSADPSAVYGMQIAKHGGKTLLSPKLDAAAPSQYAHLEQS